MPEPHHTSTPSHDAQEIRLIADILALVLDTEQGQAEAALAHLRQRAQQQNMTGGALKNLFHALTTTHPQDNQHQLEQTRQALERLALQHRHLQAHVAALQDETLILRQTSAQYRSIQPLHRMALVMAVIAGILFGIAAAEMIHSL